MAIRTGHPEAIVLAIQYRDRRDPLDPRVAGPARDDGAEREAVLEWQRLTVHFIGEQRRRMERLGHRNRALEVGHRSDGDIGAVEQHLLWRRLQAGPPQDIGETHTSPPAIADTAMAPLKPRHRRLVEAAPV